MLKKGLVLLGCFIGITGATQINPICQNAYYKGIVDSLLFADYENSIQVPNGKWWGVIDVSSNSNADIVALAIKIKSIGYNPVIVKVEGRKYLLVYAGDDKEDVANTAKGIGFADVEVIEKPPQYSKVYFSTVCEGGDTYIGIEGIIKHLQEAKTLAKKNLDAVKYAEFERLINKAIEILKSSPQIDRSKTEEILKKLF